MKSHWRDGMCARHRGLRDVRIVMMVLGATILMVVVVTRCLGLAMAGFGARLWRNGMSTYNTGLIYMRIWWISLNAYSRADSEMERYPWR